MEKYENLNPADDIFDHSAEPEVVQERADDAREAMNEPSLVDNLMNLVIENRKRTLYPVFHPEWLTPKIK